MPILGSKYIEYYIKTKGVRGCSMKLFTHWPGNERQKMGWQKDEERNELCLNISA